MAKGSAMGLWKGKKGSSVFYKIKNSNSAQKQGIRERIYEPSNPQTAAQASQRMKMLPAQRVYGAIKDVIERSWQGVDYGELARYQYLKRALKAPVFPAVAKDSNLVVPGPYQIAKGTLQEVFTTIRSSNGNVITSLVCDSITSQSTFAQFSQKLIDENPFLQNGDQLSFVFCVSNPDATADVFIWGVRSFVLDVSNSDVTFGQFNESFLGGLTFAITGNTLQVTSDNPIVYASAVIISRDDTTPLRSDATLYVNYSDLSNYYSPSAIAAARHSYMKSSSSRSADWPADPNIETLAGTIDGTYIIEGLTGVKATANGEVAKVRVDEQTGEIRAYYYKLDVDGETREIVNPSGQVITYSATSEGETVVLPLTPDDIAAFADLPGVLFTQGA